MSLDDVRKLSANKFNTDAIVKMLEERRCVCDASVDALVELKKAGVAEQVIQAVSLHALPPNRSFGLTIALDFEGLGGKATVSTQARKGYLYLSRARRRQGAGLYRQLAGDPRRPLAARRADRQHRSAAAQKGAARDFCLRGPAQDLWPQKGPSFYLDQTGYLHFGRYSRGGTGPGCRSSSSSIQPRRWSANAAFRCSTGRTRCWPTAGT